MLLNSGDFYFLEKRIIILMLKPEPEFVKIKKPGFIKIKTTFLKNFFSFFDQLKIKS